MYQHDSPDILSAIELRPDAYSAVNLSPEIIDSEDQTDDEYSPQMIGNEDLVPETETLDLRPEIISVEEE